MTVIGNEQTPIVDQPRSHRKRWFTVVIILSALTLLCVLGFCILGAIGLISGTKPKTKPVFYQDASIAHMFETCDEQR